MGRSPCCAKEGLNRGAWTAMEDKILTDYIKIHGEGSWRGLPKRAGLKRCGKSCRLRWLNYLRPDIKRGNITGDEEELIIRLHKLLGNRWSLIAGRLPGRTDNEIKNYWNTNLSKKVHNASRQKALEENKVVRRSSIATPTKDSLDPVSNVAIRTKAFKCRRVFIGPPPQPASLPPLTAPPPPTVALASPQMKDPLVKIDTNSDLNNLISSKGVPESPLMDFTSSDLSMIGELNFSDFLDSQQMLDVFCDLSQGTSNEGDQFSPSTSLEEPIVFPEDMMEDWRSSLDFASKIEFWLGDQ